MIEINLSYSDFKSQIINSKILPYQHTAAMNDIYKVYRIFAQEGNIFYFTVIDELSSQSDITDWESNYLSNSNKAIDAREPETGLIKFKPRPVEATLMMQHVYFTTGNAQSLDAPDNTWSIDCTTPGVTKVTATPPFPYYIDGGGITLIGSLPTTPLKGQFIMAPNIPAQYGGSVVLVDNLKMIFDNQRFVIDVPPKYVKYYQENPYANQAQLHITHGESEQVNMEFMARFYK
jgi:hypothetical protein